MGNMQTCVLLVRKLLQLTLLYMCALHMPERHECSTRNQNLRNLLRRCRNLRSLLSCRRNLCLLSSQRDSDVFLHPLIEAISYSIINTRTGYFTTRIRLRIFTFLSPFNQTTHNLKTILTFLISSLISWTSWWACRWA